MSTGLSYVQTDSDITADPRLGHVWRDEDGDGHAVVRLGHASLHLNSPEVAQAIAAACTAAAEALEQLRAGAEDERRPDCGRASRTGEDCCWPGDAGLPRPEAVRTCGGCAGRGTGERCCVCGGLIPPSKRRQPGDPSEVPGGAR